MDRGRVTAIASIAAWTSVRVLSKLQPAAARCVACQERYERSHPNVVRIAAARFSRGRYRLWRMFLFRWSECVQVDVTASLESTCIGARFHCRIFQRPRKNQSRADRHFPWDVAAQQFVPQARRSFAPLSRFSPESVGTARQRSARRAARRQHLPAGPGLRRRRRPYRVDHRRSQAQIAAVQDPRGRGDSRTRRLAAAPFCRRGDRPVRCGRNAMGRRLRSSSTMRSPAYSSLAKSDGLREIRVPLRTLDTVLSGHDVDVIKIDIEGGELGALRGAVRCCRTSAYRDVRERTGLWCSPRLHHDGPLAVLDRLGYVVVAPNRLAHDGDGLSLEAFNDGHVYPRRTTNYFACPA